MMSLLGKSVSASTTVNEDGLRTYVAVYYLKQMKEAIDEEIVKMIRERVAEEVATNPEVRAKVQNLVAQKLIALLESGPR